MSYVQRSFFSILRKRLRVVFSIVIILIFSSTALGIQRTVLSAYSQQIDQTFSQFLLVSSAIALTSFGLSKAVGNYLGGRLSDHIGRKKATVVGMIALIIGSIIIVIISAIFTLFLGNFFLGLGIGILFATSSVTLTDIATAEHRAKAVSLMELSVYSGTSVGAFIAGILAQTGQYYLPFLVALGLDSVILLTIPILKETKGIVEREQVEVEDVDIFDRLSNLKLDWTRYYANLEDEDLSEELSTFISNFLHDTQDIDRFDIVQQETSYLNPSILLTYSTGVVSRISDTAIILIYPLLLLELGISDFRLGVATSSFTILWAIGIGITGPVSDRIGRKIPLIGGLVMELFGLSILFLPLLNSTFPVILLGTMIAGLGRGLYFPIPTSMITDFVQPEVRGKSIGFYRLFLDTGYAIGAIILIIIVEPLVALGNPVVEVFQSALIVVIMVILIQVTLASIFLKDPRPGFWQYPRIMKHYEKVSSSFFYLTSSMVALAQHDTRQTKENLEKAKEEEQHADQIYQDLTEMTYTGAYKAPDAIELLNFSAKVDKALGHAIRGVRKLNYIDQEIPQRITKRIAQYSFILDYLVETLKESLELLPIRIELAARTTYQTSLVEELLDEIHKLLWTEIIAHRDAFEPINLLLIKEVLETLEKSANTIEDAAEIIRLINFKHVF